MVKKTGQTDLDEYIFTRPEMAKLLGISTNALRMRMRKGRCDLEYRFDGKQFMSMIKRFSENIIAEPHIKGNQSTQTKRSNFKMR